jgi:pilus assembly protein FimV
MGRLTVLSSLGHPLLAEIELVAVRKEEVSTLVPRLASPDAYRRANLTYNPALTGLRLSIERRPNGQPYIKIVSTRSVNEPFIDLLIELDSSSGRLAREYTALVDPPGYTPPQTAAEASAPAAEARPVAPPQSPAAVAAPAYAKSAAGEYGPVKRGDTLSKIAARAKPEGVSLEQMLVGILRRNPDAFINKNMNLLKAGKMLQIPEKEQLTAVTQQEARNEVRLQAADWNKYRRRLADTAGTASAGKTGESKRDSRKLKVEDQGAAAKGGKDVLRLSSGEKPGKAGKKRNDTERIQVLEEELVAREKALNEANQRIKELEQAVKGTPR